MRSHRPRIVVYGDSAHAVADRVEAATGRRPQVISGHGFHSTIGIETEWSDENASPLEDILGAIGELDIAPEPVVRFDITQEEYEFLREYARMGAFLRAHGVGTDD